MCLKISIETMTFKEKRRKLKKLIDSGGVNPYIGRALLARSLKTEQQETKHSIKVHVYL